MSVKVHPSELSDRLAEYGSSAFLGTAGANGRPHLTHVVVSLDGTTLLCGAGRKTAVNTESEPAVVLLWPPVEEGGMSLLVDGEAVVEVVGDEKRLRITPVGGVLHRSAGQSC